MTHSQDANPQNKEGWGLSPLSRKWHYFRDRDSLCRRIGFYFGEVDAAESNTPDDCAACKRILAREKKQKGGKK